MIPYIYKEFRVKDSINFTSYFVWLGYCFFCANVAFFTPILGMQYDSDQKGKDNDLYAIVLSSYHIMVIVHDIHVIMFTQNYNYFILFSYIGNFLSFLPSSLMIDNALKKNYQYKSVWESIGSVYFWCTILLGTWVCIMPLYCYMRYRYFVKPSVYHVSELILKDEHMEKED